LSRPFSRWCDYFLLSIIVRESLKLDSANASKGLSLGITLQVVTSEEEIFINPDIQSYAKKTLPDSLIISAVQSASPATTKFPELHDNHLVSSSLKPQLDPVSAAGTEKLVPGKENLNNLGNRGSMVIVDTHKQLVNLLENVQYWNWEIFELTNISMSRPLFTLSHFLFLQADLYSTFGIPVDIFLKFVTTIESGYRADVPYHNSVHATDVLHGLSFLKSACAVQVSPSNFELLCLYTAAIIHDFE
jgi:hypothetical protein